MSTNAKARRSPSSCVNCRRRKIKCDKSTSAACRRCRRLGLDCAVTDEIVARPYYHTSKERFELMATIVRHFSPDTSFTVQGLRECVSSLAIPTNGPKHPVPSQQISPPSESPSTAVEYSQTPSVADQGYSPASSINADGEFILDATLQRRFKGASSDDALQFKLSCSISSRFPRLASLQLDPTLDLRDGEPPLKSAPIALPDRKTCERCGVKFFNEINCLAYILSPEKFFNIVEVTYTGRDSLPSSQAMIHLIVALMDDSPEHFGLARMQMESVIEEGSLESVQAIMLMALYRQRQNQRLTAWVVLGNAVRIAQSLGLHIESDDDSLLLAEHKKRLWWSLYELDQWSSCCVGRPPAAGSSDLNYVPSVPETFTASNKTPHLYASASARLAQFLSAAMGIVFLQQRCRGPDVDHLIRDLKAWWDDLPETLTKGEVPTSLARATLYLRMRYHTILVLLTRPFLCESAFGDRDVNQDVDQDVSHLITICEENDDAILAILLGMHERKLLTRSFWLDIHHILSSGLVLLIRMLKTPLSPSLRNEVAGMQGLLQAFPGPIQDYAYKCFDEIIEDFNHPGENHSQIIELLLNSTAPSVATWESLDTSTLGVNQFNYTHWAC